ncbi:MAG: hypothetical protein ABJB98_04745 [Actinomycetota bacterium]
MTGIDSLQRPYSKELTVAAQAEQGESRIKKIVDGKGMDILGRAVRIGEREVALYQFANVLGSWVVNRDLAVRHKKNLRNVDQLAGQCVRSHRGSFPSDARRVPRRMVLGLGRAALA